MPEYANLSGRSGVVSYDLKPGQIEVTWAGGSDTFDDADGSLMAKALAGIGLNTEINRRRFGPPRRPKGKSKGKGKLKRARNVAQAPMFKPSGE